MERKQMKTKPISRAIAAALLFAFCANPLCYAAYSYNVSEGENGEIIIGNTAKTTAVAASKTKENQLMLSKKKKTSVLNREYTTKDGIHVKIEEVSNDKYKNLTPAQAALSEYMQEYGGMEKEEADNYSKNTIQNNVKTTQNQDFTITQKTSTISQQKLEQLEAPYKSKNQKLLKAETEQTAYEAIYDKYKQKWSDKDSDIVKINLTDGDYVAWNAKLFDKKNSDGERQPGKKLVQYAIEYHKDNSLMGIIKMKRIDENTCAFYEYRIDSAGNNSAKLKHVMTYYNDEHNAVFVYSIDGHIRSLQYDGQNYVVDLQGVPEISQVDLASLNKPEYGKAVGNAAKQAAGGIGTVLLAPVALLAMPAVFLIAAYEQEKRSE